MGVDEVQFVMQQVDDLLKQAGPLPEEAVVAIEKLLNVVEALSQDRREMDRELERLGKKLQEKKNAKTTQHTDASNSPDDGDSDHSSERHRRESTPTRHRDRRSGKNLVIHEEMHCPVNASDLPADAVRLDDEIVDVQGINITPHNIRFTREVYYSRSEDRYYRGPLPEGCDQGDFSAQLRAYIISLKYSGGMSEPMQNIVTPKRIFNSSRARLRPRQTCGPKPKPT